MGGVEPVPSAEFCRKLYRFDPDLRLTWDNTQGCWQIWYMDQKTRMVNHVMNVVENDGRFRPLDDRVFQILQMNRYYAEHPEELAKVIVDDPEAARVADRRRIEDDLRHVAKDSALRKQFEKLRETLSTLDLSELTTSRPLYDVNGRPLRNADGGVVQYTPHKSLL